MEKSENSEKIDELANKKPSGASIKSKKIKKSYNLFDFVVVKQKNRKTNQIHRVKVSKQIQKRGKARKKKLTTLKKRIIIERNVKRLKTIQEDDETVDDLAETFENIQLEDVEVKVEILPSAASTSVQHSRNFREYCNHFITQEIKQLTEVILKDLFKFQENKFQQNPVKAKANKRYVVGFKEVKKFLIVKRLKLVFIAPDIARSDEIDRLVKEIKQLCDKHQTPYVFSVKRRHIGYLLLKKVPVSVVGIFDYQGTIENVDELLKFVQQEKISYQNKTKST